MQKRMQTYHSNEVPDPEVLKAILSRESKQPFKDQHEFKNWMSKKPK